MDSLNNDTIRVIILYLNAKDTIIFCSSINHYYNILCQNESIFRDHLLLQQKSCLDNWLPNHAVLDLHVSCKIKNIRASDIKYLTKLCSKNKVYIDLLEKIVASYPTVRNVGKIVIKNSQCYDNILILLKTKPPPELLIPMSEYCRDYCVVSAFIDTYRNYLYSIYEEGIERANYCFVKNMLVFSRFSPHLLKIFLRDTYNRIWTLQYRNVHSLLYEYIVSKDHYFVPYVNKLFTHYCALSFDHILATILNDSSVLQRISYEKIFRGIIKCITNKDGLKILQWLHQQIDISIGIDTEKIKIIFKKMMQVNNREMIIFLTNVFKIDMHECLRKLTRKGKMLKPFSFSETGIHICYDFLDYHRLHCDIHSEITYRFMYRDIRFLMKHLKYCSDDAVQIKTLIKLLYISTEIGSDNSLNPLLSKMLCDKYASSKITY
uniref:F-box domain-containing protein n=1 Tax=viral metagenome TaxID=1070528 RepID=A0A6C0C9E4_9ZZZZ